MLTIMLQIGEDVHLGPSACGKAAGWPLRGLASDDPVCFHHAAISKTCHLFTVHTAVRGSTAKTIQKGYFILVQFLCAFSHACSFQFQTTIFRVKYHSENKTTVNLTPVGENVLNLILLKNQCSFSGSCLTPKFKVKSSAGSCPISRPHTDTALYLQATGQLSLHDLKFP